MARDQPRELAAQVLTHPTPAARFRHYSNVLHGSDGLTDDALVLALDHQARFVTALREQCERAKCAPPYAPL